MAAWGWYGQGILGQFGATAARRVDLTGDTLKVLLTTSLYVPGVDTHAFRNDVTNEVTGTLYVAGGQTITGKSWTYDAASNEARFVFTDPAWGPGAIIAGIRCAVLYKDTGSAATDPLIGFSILDGDQTIAGGTFSLDVDPATALKITV